MQVLNSNLIRSLVKYGFLSCNLNSVIVILSFALSWTPMVLKTAIQYLVYCAVRKLTSAWGCVTHKG